MIKRISILLAANLWLIMFLLPYPVQGKNKLHLETCFIDSLQETVHCGWLRVTENKLVRKGKDIKIHFMVLPAKGTALSDPIITFSGGPGTSALNGVTRWAQQFEKFRQDRDLLLIDQRGTGKSNPLPCHPIGDPNSAQTWLGDMYTERYVTRCRQELEESFDLKYYHTSQFVEDVEDIREALGYPQLNILTGSYGTRVAIAYMQRYPERVRCAFLWSCNITDMKFPTYLAVHTQVSMNTLLADCEADPAASADYPNLRQEFEQILDRLKQGPVLVTLTNPFTGNRETVSFGYYPFVAGIRSMLYSNSTRRWIPFFIYLAARGQFAPIAEYTAAYMKDINELYADGMYLCVECNENIARMNLEDAYSLAAGTFMGNYRIDQQKLACDLWPRSDIPENFFTPQPLDIPTLILSGENDPVTPPIYGDIIAGFMLNNLHVIVPHWPHGINADTPWWKDGFDEVALQFIQQGSIFGLDPSCVQSYTPPPFISWRDYLLFTMLPKKLWKKAGPLKN